MNTQPDRKKLLIQHIRIYSSLKIATLRTTHASAIEKGLCWVRVALHAVMNSLMIRQKKSKLLK